MPCAKRGCLDRGLTGREHAEFVSLRIGQNHPGNLALPNIDPRSSHPDQPLHLGSLVVGTEVDMETVLPLLGFVDGQEQDPG